MKNHFTFSGAIVPLEYAGFCIFEIDVTGPAIPGGLHINSSAIPENDAGELVIPTRDGCDVLDLRAILSLISRRVPADPAAPDGVFLSGHVTTTGGIAFAFDCTYREFLDILHG